MIKSTIRKTRRHNLPSPPVVQKPKEDDNAKQQAKAQLESILEMVETLEVASKRYDELSDCEPLEAAREAITNDALSVETRTAWMPVGYPDRKSPEEFRILLCTGGPAVQIVGELNEHGEPHIAMLQYQDWFTPWTNYPLTLADEKIVLVYASQFYYGEG